MMFIILFRRSAKQFTVFFKLSTLCKLHCHDDNKNVKPRLNLNLPDKYNLTLKMDFPKLNAKQVCNAEMPGKFVFLLWFQFCCANGVFHVSLLSANADDHLQCSVPHYVFLTCVMTYISVSVFLKLAAGIKLILMFVMGAGYIVVMEVTHSTIFNDFDDATKYVCSVLKVHIDNRSFLFACVRKDAGKGREAMIHRKQFSRGYLSLEDIRVWKMICKTCHLFLLFRM